MIGNTAAVDTLTADVVMFTAASQNLRVVLTP
jgi:hypothetical protein